MYCVCKGVSGGVALKMCVGLFSCGNLCAQRPPWEGNSERVKVQASYSTMKLQCKQVTIHVSYNESMLQCKQVTVHTSYNESKLQYISTLQYCKLFVLYNSLVL